MTKANGETLEDLMLNMPIFDYGRIERPKTALECVAVGSKFLVLVAQRSELEFRQLVEADGFVRYEAECYMKLAKRFGLEHFDLLIAAESVSKLFLLDRLNDAELFALSMGKQVFGITLEKLPRMTSDELSLAMDVRYLRSKVQQWRSRIS